jgi:hypothetical protein
LTTAHVEHVRIVAGDYAGLEGTLIGRDGYKWLRVQLTPIRAVWVHRSECEPC